MKPPKAGSGNNTGMSICISIARYRGAQGLGSSRLKDPKWKPKPPRPEAHAASNGNVSGSEMRLTGLLLRNFN